MKCCNVRNNSIRLNRYQVHTTPHEFLRKLECSTFLLLWIPLTKKWVSYPLGDMLINQSLDWNSLWYSMNQWKPPPCLPHACKRKAYILQDASNSIKCYTPCMNTVIQAHANPVIKRFRSKEKTQIVKHQHKCVFLLLHDFEDLCN